MTATPSLVSRISGLPRLSTFPTSASGVALIRSIPAAHSLANTIFQVLVVKDVASSTYSWTVGPADSRLVRTLLYLATALVPAYPIVVVMDAINLISQSRRILIIGILFAVVLVIVLARTLLAIQASPTYWVLGNFIEELRLRWLGVTTLIAIIGLATVARWIGMVHLAFFLLWFPCLGGIMLLSSQGAIDREKRVFTYVTVRRHEISLDAITAVKILTVGERTYLWLSFQTTGGAPANRLVMVPTDIFKKIESLINPARGPGADQGEKGSQSRVELFAGLLVFGGISVGLAVILYLSGAPLTYR